MKRRSHRHIVLVLLICCAYACLTNDELNLEFTSYTPVDLGDGLTLSTPEAQHVDPDALASIYEDVYHSQDFWSLRSLLVFRNGSLIAEAYLKDEQDVTNRHLIWSCTKQVMGILTGIALEEGIIGDVNDPMSDYFDTELAGHEDKADITLHNLLIMRSGIDYDNDGLAGETDKLLRQLPDNSVEFILSRPVNADQGSTFHYNDGNPHLVSAILQKQLGRPTDEWADEVFFSKIGMTNYNWIRYRDGITMGGYGIETSPREMAKIALCVADSGRWKGQQVIDPGWLDQMLTPHETWAYGLYHFGYLWWIDNTRNIFFMSGHGGQYTFIVPDKQLVVVMTSIPNTQGRYQIQTWAALELVDRIAEAAE